MKIRTLLAAALVAGSLGASRAQAQLNVAVGGGPYPNLFTGTLAPMYEKETGKKFGDPRNSLLVSVRSGARDSMQIGRAHV